MPKGGSGFMRAAGRAASSILGGRGGSWTVADLQDATQSVQRLYANAYRSDAVTLDSRGRMVGTGRGFDRFADQAEALAKRLSRDVLLIDREAEREYRDMSRMARSIRASDAERREFEQTYRGEKLLSGRGGSTKGDASEVAREMARMGLLSHEAAALGNNVDVMNAVNSALNAAKGRIYTPVSKSGSATDFEGDIFMGLVEGYRPVASAANRRRKK